VESEGSPRQSPGAIYSKRKT